MSTNKKLIIKSAEQALKESMQLESVWSGETRLSQRILIYIAKLLENLIHEQKRKQTKPHKPTAWNIHVSKVLKAGGTIKEAAEQWRRPK